MTSAIGLHYNRISYFFTVFQGFLLTLDYLSCRNRYSILMKYAFCKLLVASNINRYTACILCECCLNPFLMLSIPQLQNTSISYSQYGYVHFPCFFCNCSSTRTKIRCNTNLPYYFQSSIYIRQLACQYPFHDFHCELSRFYARILIFISINNIVNAFFACFSCLSIFYIIAQPGLQFNCNVFDYMCKICSLPKSFKKTSLIPPATAVLPQTRQKFLKSIIKALYVSSRNVSMLA